MFTLRANTESGFCQYLRPSPLSLLFVSATVRARRAGLMHGWTHGG